MMINKTRILNEFIELVSVPCPSKDEKAEADLLVQKLQAMGLEVKVDDAGRKIGGTTGNVWAFLSGNVEGAAGLFFEAHMDSVPPTTGTKVVLRDGVLYSDGTTTLGGDDKVGIAAVLEAVPPQAVRAAAAPAMPAAARKLRREMRWSFISVFLLQVKNILFLRPAKENRAGKPYLRAHSPSRPAAMRTPCSRLGRMYSRFSCTALGLPGRLTMSVLPRSTLTPRLSIPRGVMLRL